VRRPPTVTSGDPASDEQLARERTLIETARSAVARREGEAALRAVDEHERAFPAGRLREEREALAVSALALASQHEQARIRAARFRARYPHGLFLPVVEAAVPQ